MKTYEEWVATRFVKDRDFSDEIANIIRDGPLRLPERKGWQLYMTPQMQNVRELAHMKTADEGRANQRLLREEIDDVKRNNDPGPAVDVGFVAETMSSQNGAAPAMQQFAEGLARSHQAYVDGVDRRSREELDRLAQEIRAAHERERIANEINASRIDALHADRVRLEGLVAQASQAVGAPAPTVDLSTTNQHMANMEAALNRQQESFRAAAAEMMRENREFLGRIAAQQGLTAAQVQEMLERRLADVQPTVVQPTVVDARTVNIDARSVDARTVAQDSRTVVIHQVDNRSVAQVVNVSGGPPPPPPPGAGAIRTGPTGPLPTIDGHHMPRHRQWLTSWRSRLDHRRRHHRHRHPRFPRSPLEQSRRRRAELWLTCRPGLAHGARERGPLQPRGRERLRGRPRLRRRRESELPRRRRGRDLKSLRRSLERLWSRMPAASNRSDPRCLTSLDRTPQPHGLLTNGSSHRRRRLLRRLP
jgi:hypothetical protein